MTHLSIIGTGTMGQAIAGLAVRGGHTVELVGSADTDAKATLAGVVTSGGLNAIDAGSLTRARELEAVGFLQLTLAVNEKVSWTGGFGVVV